MDELISVIIPVYRVEKYLDECVKSVVRQTYKNLEIILIDDGSTDACPSICDKWAELDNRIKVIHKLNGGLSDARNAGINIAKGEYITFVDSDDYISGDYIEQMYSRITSDIDIVCAGYIRVTDNGKIIENCHGTNTILTKNEAMRELVENGLIATTAWGKLYRKKLFSELRFDYGKYHEDIYIMHEILHRVRKVIVSEMGLYYYRVNDQSITGVKFNPKHQDAVYSQLKRLNFIKASYPELINIQKKVVVWHACDNNLKILKSLKGNETFFRENNIIIRKYFKEFISSDASIKAKVFAAVRIGISQFVS